MSEIAIYPEEARQRLVAEAHSPALRSDFERDRARILHSSALRRLGDKTQVWRAGANDFVRTRLTHSLEVAQVGRELGKALGCDPDVVDTACLAHDLGHPPFGHNGERVLNKLAAEIGGFEGNAQTFRILVRLEPKVAVPTATGYRPAGLNLTRASLDATSKYPWARGDNPADPASPKFGVYRDDLPTFIWMREGAAPGRKCLEAQVMDLADDIGYSVHDLEDAIRSESFIPQRLESSAEFENVVASTQNWYGPGISADALAGAYQRLRQTETLWLNSFDRSYRDLAALKNSTSQLIGRFTMAALSATHRAVGTDAEPLSRYQADLVVPPETRAEIMLLKGIAAHYVMLPREHTHDHVAQQQTLADLVEALSDAQSKGKRALEEPFGQAWLEAVDAPVGKEAARLRAVIDQVASLTDVSATQWHATWCGMFSKPL